MLQLAAEGYHLHNVADATYGRDAGNDTSDDDKGWQDLEVAMHHHSLGISEASMDRTSAGETQIGQGNSDWTRPWGIFCLAGFVRERLDEESRGSSMGPGIASFLSLDMCKPGIRHRLYVPRSIAYECFHNNTFYHGLFGEICFERTGPNPHQYELIHWRVVLLFRRNLNTKKKRTQSAKAVLFWFKSIRIGTKHRAAPI